MAHCNEIVARAILLKGSYSNNKAIYIPICDLMIIVWSGHSLSFDHYDFLEELTIKS